MIAHIFFKSIQDMLSHLSTAWSLFESLWYLIVPFAVYPLWKMLWMDYIQAQYAGKLSYVLLELIPPREIERSPLPMESIFNGFAGVDKGFTVYEAYIQGQFPAKFSLELVSTEGAVHYYIRSLKNYRNLVEAHIYAQYPDAEIIEVPDYIDTVPRSIPNHEWDLWGADIIHTKEDLYPIRTYIHFEEDVTGKMVDPLSGVIEALGKAGPGEHLWFQMIIVQDDLNVWLPKAKKMIDAFLNGKPPESLGLFATLWHELIDVVKNIIPALFGSPSFTNLTPAEKKSQDPVEFRLTPGQKDILKAMERNMGKLVFRTKMRFLYLGRREVFDKAHVSNFVGSLKQFNDINLNGFKPDDDTKTYANYLFTKERLRYRQRRLFRRYISRDGDPSKTKIGLSTEELATIFHPPDQSVVAPSMMRVSARRSMAPSNLPIMEE